MPKLKRKSGKKHNKRDENPFKLIRKKIPRTGGPMKSAKDYTRRSKYNIRLEITGE